DQLHELMKSSFSTEAFGVQVPSTPLRSKDDARAEAILEARWREVGNGTAVEKRRLSTAQQRISSLKKTPLHGAQNGSGPKLCQAVLREDSRTLGQRVCPQTDA